MSFQAKRELLANVAPRYREENKKRKSIILNEFISATGYSRKYAIRLLSFKQIPVMKRIKKPRPRFYNNDVQEALKIAWAAANYIASKRLAPFLTDLVPTLERHGHLNLNDETRSQLISISPATIDRILKPIRNNSRSMSTTKPGKLLKHQIPIRTFTDWEDEEPGFFEADLVAHCGWSMEGEFLHTLVLTDIATGWVECMALPYRSGSAVVHALDKAQQLIPFPILGIDTDNGSEFINADLIRYCEKEKITFTRGRAYKKNDQCYVEQKNGIVVRQIVGYDRFEGSHAYMQLSELYRAVRLYVNFFQPSMKLKKKCRDNSKIKKTYDSAQTPFRRLKKSVKVRTSAIEKLDSINHSLDPVRLLKQIQFLQDALWKHVLLAKQPSPSKKEEKQPLYGFKLESTPKEFVEKNNNDHLVLKTGIMKRRQYRKTKKPRVKHWWKTREDPFENVWDEARSWLENDPEKTATLILLELQKKYPGRYSKGQLRTLQRRVKAWREKAIITYDDNLLKRNPLAEDSISGDLKAITVDALQKEKKENFAVQ